MCSCTAAAGVARTQVPRPPAPCPAPRTHQRRQRHIERRRRRPGVCDPERLAEGGGRDVIGHTAACVIRAVGDAQLECVLHQLRSARHRNRRMEAGVRGAVVKRERHCSIVARVEVGSQAQRHSAAGGEALAPNRVGKRCAGAVECLQVACVHQ